MKKTMKAAIINEHSQDLEIKEVPIPDLSRGEVLVKAEASGVCHTDLHAKIGDWPVKPNLPLIPGHESIGKIVDVGEGVTSLKVGDRIGNAWLHSACGECEYCLTGRETLCHYQQNSGYSVDGGYAEYFKVQADYAARIPENLNSEEAAPLLCAGVTTYKALKISGAKPGDWVSVFGIGGLGHLAVQYAKAMGMNVIAVDIHDEKLELAKELGADKTVNSIKTDPVEFINNEVGGVQAAISVAVVPKAFEQAYESMKRGGTLVAVALPNEDMSLPIFETVLDAKNITGSIVGTRKDLQEALDFAAQGKVKANISVEPLENINDIFQRMEDGKIDGRIVMSIE